MSKNTQLSDDAVNAQADLLARRLDNGYLRIYDGSQPANANTAVGAQVMLAELRFAATSAPAASGGVITFSAITPVNAVAGGNASWFRALKSDGTSVVMDGSVDIAANTPNMVVGTVIVVAGNLFVITGFTHTVAKATTGY